MVMDNGNYFIIMTFYWLYVLSLDIIPNTLTAFYIYYP